jgi:uncharacterized protein (DUF488 family)
VSEKMKAKICTIGFAKKPLRTFVELLKQANVQVVIDTRLHNTSQLSGYAKKDDLAFILEILGIGYIHDPLLAPTEEILKAYKNKEMAWGDYEEKYVELLKMRKVEQSHQDLIAKKTVCLLCSEHAPHYCHRRLLAEYLRKFYSDIEIVHLM